MKVRDVMTVSPEVIAPDASVREAAEMMKYLDVGALPVCQNDRIVGMVTDRDIALRSDAEGRDPAITKVKEAMSPGVAFCADDDDVKTARKLMEEKQVRRLPVLDAEQRLIGIVSLGDIAVSGHDEKGAGHTLERVSEPGRPRR